MRSVSEQTGTTATSRSTTRRASSWPRGGRTSRSWPGEPGSGCGRRWPNRANCPRSCKTPGSGPYGASPCRRSRRRGGGSMEFAPSPAAEPVAAPDRGGIMAFRGSMALQPPRQVSFVDYEAVGVSSEFATFFRPSFFSNREEASGGSRGAAMSPRSPHDAAKAAVWMPDDPSPTTRCPMPIDRRTPRWGSPSGRTRLFGFRHGSSPARAAPAIQIRRAAHSFGHPW
jgi:hypothetical protein